MVNNIEGELSIVISGSFRKYYTEIRNTIKEFESLGFQVLSPKHSNVVNPEGDFVLLESDETTCPEKIEREHLKAIYRADALYLYNPEGYIGPSSAMEMGWALALEKPIYVKDICEDITLRYFTIKTDSLEQIKMQLIEKHTSLYEKLSPQSSLQNLQSYIKHVFIERGFDSETPRDKVLLMLEEFGELAKALRKYVGLKIDKHRKQRYTELKYELADILIYLLDLSNACNIDLFEAFKEKEHENKKRRWGNIDQTV